jgi:GntR family transcriptional regulator/MocR family aminotransferase
MKDSPVNTLIQELIDFDKSISQPVFIQVSQQIINAIQRRYLSKGTRLPGTRVFAELLKIHRNTAVAIYDELASQGWVEIIPNKGTFVLEPELKPAKIKAPLQQIHDAYKHARETGFSFQSSFHLASTIQITNSKYTINDGTPDLRLHPVYEFTRWYSSAMKRKTLIKKWNRPNESSYSLFQILLIHSHPALSIYEELASQFLV